MIKIIYSCEDKFIEFAEDTDIRITNIDGLNNVSVNMTETTLTDQIGATIVSSSVEPKDITIEGRFKENNVVRAQLLSTVLPMKKGRIRYIDSDSNIDVYVDGQPKQTPFISNSKTWQNFQFVFRAPYPYWKSTTASINPFMEYTSDFKFARSYSATQKFKIASRKYQLLKAIMNNGVLETGFVVTMKALSNSIKAPYLINVDTQEKIRFGSLTLQEGDVIEVSTYINDVYCKLIRNNVESNIYADSDYESIFFQLKPGKNVIRYGADANEQNMDVRIDFEDVYPGV